MAPYVIYMVGLDGWPVDLVRSDSLRNAVWVRNRLRLAESQRRTDRPHYAVYDADDPERGSSLDLDDERKAEDGSYIVPVDDLRVGDRLRMTAGGGRATWWPIVRIAEKPKTRRLFLNLGTLAREADLGLLRRTTMVARAPREGEDS